MDKKIVAGGIMRANEYQKLAARTLIDKPEREITDGEIMIGLERYWACWGSRGSCRYNQKGNLSPAWIKHDRVDKRNWRCSLVRRGTLYKTRN